MGIEVGETRIREKRIKELVCHLAALLDPELFITQEVTGFNNQYFRRMKNFFGNVIC